MSLDLRDRAAVTALDPKGMWGLTEKFGDQCRTALRIAREANLTGLPATPKNAVLTGLGGSAAGGDFVRALFDAFGEIPFGVNRDYHLPKWVDAGTLLFATSYSGNTEETLSAYADAQAVGAPILAVTSGGKLKELAERDGHPVIVVPGGQPPRTALGFMLIPVLVACEAYGLLPAQDYDRAFDLLDRCAGEWTIEGSDSGPRDLATAFHGALPIVYGLGPWQGLIASRWKSQINENSKSHAFVNTFPELNHNEILAWIDAGNQGVAKYVGAVLEDGTESAKMQTRQRVTEGLVKDLIQFTTVRAQGEDLLSKLLTLTFYGDFVSLYLSALNGVDPETIDSINTLKSELANVA